MSICHRVPSSCTPVAISFNSLLPYKSYRKKVSILPSFGLRVAFIQRLGEYLFKTSFRGKGFLNVKNHVSSIILSWSPELRLAKFKTLSGRLFVGQQLKEAEEDSVDLGAVARMSDGGPEPSPSWSLAYLTSITI